MSATTKLGRVTIVGRGLWNSITEYEPLDVVTYDGSSYLVLAPCVGVIPPNDYYYSLLAERGATGATGPRGATGATGAKGDKGDTGTGLDIKGIYATVDALTGAIAAPAQGDMYFVGTAAPYTVYMWDTTSGTGAWVAQGELQGAKGDTGPVFTPTVSADAVISWTNNGGLTNPPAVSVRGPQGDPGEGVPMGGYPGQILMKNGSADFDAAWMDGAVLVEAALYAASWVGNAAPFTYTLTLEGVAANNTVELLPGGMITAEELKALQGANIQDGGQTDDSITLKAFGKKPAIDLPVRFIVRRGL